MAITIGTTPFPTLTAQPFGYEETDTRRGWTARRWLITGLLKPSEWLALLTTYDTWRNARIQNEDSLKTGTVGSTVNFSGTGAGNQTWTTIACWFISSPSAEQAGRYLSVSVELVDATQALQVALKAQEGEAEEDLPDFGTITLGTTVLTLRKPIDSYRQGPDLELTAIGRHYITGPLVVERVRDIEGTTTETGWQNIRTWYEEQIVATPAVGSYFPITPPSATAEIVLVNGVKTTRYTVAIQLGRVL
jgi:hypothetical protein